MRIRSVRLRNYKIHRELSVEFDPSRTLLGGPNESGKSTLAEAIHRGLFLKAKGSSEHHRGMLPRSAVGNPEIEIQFEVEGERHTLRKAFGRNGSTVLESHGRSQLRDAEAEEALSRILKSKTSLGNSDIKTHWSHLWVWQGTAVSDFSPHTSAVAETLVQRLQQQGAGAVLKSPLDQKVANRFRHLVDEAYTQRGQIKAGSDLANAQGALRTEMQTLEEAQTNLQNKESAIERFREAQKALSGLSRQREELRSSEEQYRERTRQLSDLERQRTSLESAVERLGKRLQDLQETDFEIKDLEQKVQAATQGLEPARERIRNLESAVREVQGQCDQRLREAAEASEKARLARSERDLADAHEKKWDAHDRKTKLDAEYTELQRLESGISQVDAELRKLPNIGQDELSSLGDLSGNLEKIRASLNAMGVRLELVRGGRAVFVGDAQMKVGEPLAVLDSSALKVGDDVELRVSPGSGLEMSEMRKQEAEAANALKEALAEGGVETLELALEVFRKREAFLKDRRDLDAERKALKPERLEKQRKEAEEQLKEAGFKVQRLSAQLPAFAAPADMQAALALLRKMEDRVEECDEAERKSREWSDQTYKEHRSRVEILEQEKERIQKAENDLQTLKIRHATLVQSAGDAAARPGAISKAQGELDREKMALTELLEQINALQPGQMEAEGQRITRVREQLREFEIRWASQQSAAEQQLRVDGIHDPRAAVAEAEARVQLREKQCRNIQRRMDAVRLLDTLFEEAQEELNDRFTQPLKQKVEGYLRCIFGSSAQGAFSFSNEGLAGLALQRSETGDSPMEFESLSAGTREQTAAAFRLAIAEVLAEEYGGAIPVIFDDAFANSDSERVRSVNRMLDLAASRGLQIILLSCTPEDYADLGASTVYIQRPARQASGVLDSARRDRGRVEASPVEEYPVPAGDDAGLCESFMQALEELGGSSGNASLLRNLCWDENTYARIKDELLERGRIVTGRGRGGSVAMVPQD